MEAREAQRVNSIKSQRAQKDSVMAKTQHEKDWQQTIKREQELIRREDRQENVARIAKAQEYHKKRILDKIEYDSMKSQHVKEEKGKLMEMRAQVRREADKQKQGVMEAFESMKKKGKVTQASLH